MKCYSRMNYARLRRMTIYEFMASKATAWSSEQIETAAISKSRPIESPTSVFSCRSSQWVRSSYRPHIRLCSPSSRAGTLCEISSASRGCAVVKAFTPPPTPRKDPALQLRLVRKGIETVATDSFIFLFSNPDRSPSNTRMLIG